MDYSLFFPAHAVIHKSLRLHHFHASGSAHLGVMRHFFYDTESQQPSWIFLDIDGFLLIDPYTSCTSLDKSISFDRPRSWYDDLMHWRGVLSGFTFSTSGSVVCGFAPGLTMFYCLDWKGVLMGVLITKVLLRHAYALLQMWVIEFSFPCFALDDDEVPFSNTRVHLHDLPFQVGFKSVMLQLQGLVY
jgi:hypothetical protein